MKILPPSKFLFWGAFGTSIVLQIIFDTSLGLIQRLKFCFGYFDMAELSPYIFKENNAMFLNFSLTILNFIYQKCPFLPKNSFRLNTIITSKVIQNPMKGGVGFYWKKRDISPPCDPFFFLGKKFFFGFSEKFSKFFFNEIDCQKFSNFFYNEVSSKKFFNSLKMTTKNFRNFFQ